MRHSGEAVSTAAIFKRAYPMKFRNMLLATLGLAILAGSFVPANAQEHRRHHRHHRHHRPR
jgi:hypothetical protein